MPPNFKRYTLRLALGLLAYAGMLAVSLRLLGHGITSPALRIAVSTAPMLPVLFVARVILRELLAMDEMMRKMQFEALAIAFTGTALATLTYGFLENAGLPKLSMFAVWPIMAVLWVVGLGLGWLRYR